MSIERLSHGDLLMLKRWSTPSAYNGWEQITRHDVASQGFSLEEVRDFMPQMGPMVGYAVTMVIEPSQSAHRAENPHAWQVYRRYVASVAGPKIVVVQDLDKPRVVGAFWGEVNSSAHRALGCVGSIADGAIRPGRDGQRGFQGPGPAALRGPCPRHASALELLSGGLRPYHPARSVGSGRPAWLPGYPARG